VDRVGKSRTTTIAALFGHGSSGCSALVWRTGGECVVHYCWLPGLLPLVLVVRRSRCIGIGIYDQYDGAGNARRLDVDCRGGTSRNLLRCGRNYYNGNVAEFRVIDYFVVARDALGPTIALEQQLQLIRTTRTKSVTSIILASRFFFWRRPRRPASRFQRPNSRRRYQITPP
jgi:hypothetical protein